MTRPDTVNTTHTAHETTLQPRHPNLARALALAQANQHLCSPNPSVGCVLLKDGVIIGEGATQASTPEYGGAHAEVMALRDAAARGFDAAGATAYVTLEPCNHTGRTEPCSSALIDAKVGRVVAAMLDPNPRTSGAGMARIAAAGIATYVLPTDDPFLDAVFALNAGFFKRMVHGTPWLRLKVAASLDGRTALPNGQSQWITNATSRADGHRWRARACAVATGVGTVLADDPKLNVRHIATQRQPKRIVFDSQLRTPLTAQLFDFALDFAEQTIFVHAAHAPAERIAALQKRGVHLLQTGDLQVNLADALQGLAAMQINEIHLEAGASLNGAFLAAGLVDEVLLYQAPLILGAGYPLATLPAFDTLAAAPRLQLLETTPMFEGERSGRQDLRLRFATAHSFTRLNLPENLPTHY